MSAEDSRHGRGGPPSPWVLRFAGRVPPGGAVVDIACGGGRHGRLFLDRGRPVTFVDVDTSGVTDLKGKPGVEIVEQDLEGGGAWALEGRRFAGVVVTNYLWRPILPNIIGLVAPGGLLIYETFARGNEAYGRPRNPDFLLGPGELIEAVRGRLTSSPMGSRWLPSRGRQSSSTSPPTGPPRRTDGLKPRRFVLRPDRAPDRTGRG
jgi:SAM-dependent methyltransferase